jgi:hypothetical protein
MADHAARIDSKEATQLAGFSLSTAAIGRQRSPRIGPTFGQGSKRAIEMFRKLSGRGQGNSLLACRVAF